MLEPTTVPEFLLRHGLLREEHMVDADFKIVDASRRNHNFKVFAAGASYLIKQGVGDDKVRTVAREALVYETAQASPALAVSRLMPKLCLYEPAECILVVELLVGSKTLLEHYGTSRRFSTALARSLGGYLAEVHASGAAFEARGGKSLSNNWRPFGLFLHEPDMALFRAASQASAELLSVLQATPRLGELLEGVRRQWRADALIHADLRWDNCHVIPATGGRLDLRLADWELANVGDRAWDLGVVFGEHLRCWLQSAPVSTETPPEEFIHFAEYPLAKMQPAIRAFWASYSRRCAPTKAASEELLLHAIRYSAVWLLQTAFEWSQFATRMTNQTVLLLQLSLNILLRPKEAAVLLFGAEGALA